MTKSKPIEEMNYEEAFAELEAVVALLEAGEKPLEETLEAYARGQLLLKRCAELLEKADLQVRQLTGGREQSMEEEE
jgi:exodeoxyribonuclease VII small subunit